MIKSNRMIWVGHGVLMGEEVWRGNLEERYYFQYLAVDGRIIVK
jgi:hypothetical protein